MEDERAGPRTPGDVMARGDASATTDRNAWVRAAVERFEGPLARYAFRIVGEMESARDIVQETFLKLCGQDRDRVEPHLAEWLFTVCRNRALDVLRKEKRVKRSSEPELSARNGATSWIACSG
jgi:RNA polymerase sigma-70 factor (ECF subfamily)